MQSELETPIKMKMLSLRKRKPKNKKKVTINGDLQSIPWIKYGSGNTSVYKFIRIFNGPNFNQQAAVDSISSASILLSSLPNSSEFTNLFDQYRIDYVEVTFRPQYNMSTISSQSSQVNPVLYTVIDYDDATNVAAVTDLQQYSNCKECRFDETCVRRFQPRIAQAVYSGAFTSFGNTRGWVDCASAGVQWYGIKSGCSGGASGQTNLQSWTVQFKVALSFRNVR